jgi:NTE family protein
LRGFLFEGGIYLGNAFEKWMEDELRGACFKDLPRNLFVTAVDLFGREPFFFSKQTTPDVRVSRAVRCSMSIPWVWRALRYERRLLVDGQLMPWIPNGIELMESVHGGPPARTVMLRMVSGDARQLPQKEHLWPWDFAKILLDTMLNALENQRVPGSLWQDTILIEVQGIHTLQLDLTPADKEKLFQWGYDQAKRYFHKKSAEKPPVRDNPS